MIPSKKSTLFLLAAAAIFAAGCSHAQSATTGGGGGGGTFSITGSVVGLLGSGLVLENNGTTDAKIKGTGTVYFTFTSNSSGLYNIVVKTQPNNPVQACSVVNGAGTATKNMANVQVSCQQSYTVSGTVSGLLGSGLVLTDNGADNNSISGTGNVPFSFNTPVVSGATYDVEILTFPTNPKQVCITQNNTGTITSDVNNVLIICQQPTYTINGTLIGLVNGAGDTVELQDNAGDDLYVTGNDSIFQMPTPVTNNGIYNVTVFLQPTSQPQPCNVFNGSGVATGNVSNVVIDCQHNDWAWIFGSTGTNNYASTANEYVFPDTNSPGGRDFGITWLDGSGRKWLFGGYGYPLATTPPQSTGFLNDLWVWDDTRGGWVPANLPVYFGTDLKWHSDPTYLEFLNLAGIYGTKGTANVLVNYPGARWGGVSWTDGSGNLWMFGGQGYDSAGTETGLLNDIWEFVPIAGPNDLLAGTEGGEWIWQGGPNTFNQAGTYGAMGTPGGYPGGRWGAASWTDTVGNVWMFGGQGYDSAGNEGLLNDLWKYNIGSGQWTWVAGSNLATQNGTFGPLGTPGAGFVPGGRQTAVLTVDPTTGNVWVFGGFGLDSTGTSTPEGAVLNDLWMYNPGTTQWTWVSGGSAANQNGVYGTQIIAAATNVPGSRWGPNGWTDASGNVWVFGGWGYGSSLAKGTGFLNDIWEYQQSTKQWTWWKGSSDVNQNGAYLYHISNTNNLAGARRGASRWGPGPLDYVWVFGGQGYGATAATGNGYLSDMWTYLPYP